MGHDLVYEFCNGVPLSPNGSEDIPGKRSTPSASTTTTTTTWRHSAQAWRGARSLFKFNFASRRRARQGKCFGGGALSIGQNVCYVSFGGVFRRNSRESQS